MRRWIGGNTRRKKWRTAGDKQQVQQVNGENGDHSVRKEKKRKIETLFAVDVRRPPDHVWDDICRAGVSKFILWAALEIRCKLRHVRLRESD